MIISSIEKNLDTVQTISGKELAKRWGVSHKSIENRRYRNDTPAYFKIGGKVRYDLQDVRRFEQKCYVDSRR